MARKKRKGIQPNDYLLHEFSHPGEIAVFYGFSPVELSKLTKMPKVSRTELKYLTKGQQALYPTMADREAMISVYDSHSKSLPFPIMLYYEKPASANSFECSLEIIGSHDAVGEGILIQTAIAILKEEGYKDLSVKVNSIGDRDSATRFEKELVAHYRKNLGVLPSNSRIILKDNPFDMISIEKKSGVEFDEPTPQSISFLNDEGSKHFKSVLEYLERLDMPYEIDPTLTLNKDYFSHTLVEIYSGNELVAVCARHDNSFRRLRLRNEIPAIGINIKLKSPLKKKRKVHLKKIAKPQFYFVQLGFEAKLKSLNILETLRCAGVPIQHALTKDKIVGQLNSAENAQFPFVLIMGQKEAMEDTVVVRDIHTRSQETIEVYELHKHLKKKVKKAAAKKTAAAKRKTVKKKK